MAFLAKYLVTATGKLYTRDSDPATYDGSSFTIVGDTLTLLNNTVAGHDTVYLTGNFADYTQTVNAATGVYTFTRGTEVINISATTFANRADIIYFNDGHITLRTDVSYGTGGNLLQGGVYREIQAADIAHTTGTRDISSGAEAVLGASTTANVGGATTIVVNDASGVDLAPTLSGQKIVVKGGAGVERVFVTENTGVDFRGAGSGNDVAYLTGNLADYTQTISGATYTFTRKDNPNEYLIVTGSSSNTNSDYVYFADGSLKMDTDQGQASGSPLATAGVYRQVVQADLNPNLVTPKFEPPAVTHANISITGISVDTGTDNNDYITSDNDGLTVNAKLSQALNTGETIWYSNNNGTSWANVTASLSGLDISLVDAALQSTNTVQFEVRDSAGVVISNATQLVTIDITPPDNTAAVAAVLDNVGTVTGLVANGGITDDTKLFVSGTLNKALATGETVRVYDGATFLGIAGVSDTEWIFVDTRTLTHNQTVSYTARVADAAGNQSAEATPYLATVDLSTPARPSELDLATADDTGSRNSDNITSQSSDLTISGTAEAGSTVRLFNDADNDDLIDDGELLATVSATQLLAGVDITLPVLDTPHSIKAIATNGAGNSGAASDALDIRVVDNAPLTYAVAGNGNVVENAGTISFTITRSGDISHAGSVEFTLSGTADRVASLANFSATDAKTDYAYQTGTAGVSFDHGTNLGSVSFAAGESSKTITFDLNNDTMAEAKEAVTMLIQNATVGNIPSATGSATVEITDNDSTYYAIASSHVEISEGEPSEGEPSPNNYVTFTFTRSGATHYASSIDFTMYGDALLSTTALPGDYSFASQSAGAGSISFNPDSSTTGTVNFAANQTTASVTFKIENDIRSELTETISAILSNPSDLNPSYKPLILVDQADTAILDDETAKFDVKADQASIDEGGSMTFTITRSGDTSKSGSVDFLLSGSAEQVLDYATMGVTGTGVTYNAGSNNWTVSFGAGDRTKTITVSTINDSDVEVTENVRIIIENGKTLTNDAFMGNVLASTNIQDNDNIFWSVAVKDVNNDGIADVDVDETSGFITYIVSRTGNLNIGAGIDFNTTAAGSATAGTYTEATQTWSPGADYDRKENTLVYLNAGDDSAEVKVRINDDFTSEATETVVGVISSPQSTPSTIVKQSAVANIIDNDAIVWKVEALANIDPASGEQTPYFENGGSVFFKVTRSGNKASPASIDISTYFGSAEVGLDYSAIGPGGIGNTKTLNFISNQLEYVLEVKLINDTDKEPTQAVSVHLSNPSGGGIIYGGSAYNTILDDDSNAWSLAVAKDSFENEGYVKFIVSRTHDFNIGSVRLNLGTLANGRKGSADNEGVGKDFTDVSQDLIFNVGQKTYEITVPVVKGTDGEPNETINAWLTTTAAGLNDRILTGQVAAVIFDDDYAHFNISTSTVATEEGQYALVTVTRSGQMQGNASVVMKVSAGSANVSGAGADITLDDNALLSGKTLTFVEGEPSKTIKIKINADGLPEGAEDFLVQLSSPSTGAVLDSYAVRPTIAASGDNNGFSNWSIKSDAAYVYEQNGFVTYTITRSGNLNETGSVTIGFSGTAEEGATKDYVKPASATVSFDVGEAKKVVQVALNADADNAEGLETLTATITKTASADMVTTSTATTQILDSGEMLWFVSGSRFDESFGLLEYTVSRLGDMSKESTIAVNTKTYTVPTVAATAGDDYLTMSDLLTFKIGETSKNYYVQVIDDGNPENQERLWIELSAPSHGVIVSQSSTSSYTADLFIDNDDDIGQSAFVLSAGNDVLNALGSTTRLNVKGGLGDDYIVAPTGQWNILEGGAGADTLIGGATFPGVMDAIIYQNSHVGIRVELGNGINPGFGLYGDADGDELHSIEQVNATEYDDYIVGRTDVNSTLITVNGDDYVQLGDFGGLVLAGNGADTVYGGAGNDTLRGDSQGDTEDFFSSFKGVPGDDLLVGNGGNDGIYAHGGADTLNGGAGNDTLKGGTGIDTFVYTGLDMTSNAGLGLDTITDFSLGDGDKLAFDQYFYGSVTAATVGNFLRVTGIGASAVLEVNRDGSGSSYGWTQLVKLTNGAFTNDNLAAMVTAGQITFSPVVNPSGAPVLTITSPADNAPNVSFNSNIVLTFDRAVKADSGDIVLSYIDNTGGSVSRAISINDATQVSVSANVVTINPTDYLASGGTYKVTMASGVLRNMTDNTAFGGLIDGVNALDFSVSGSMLANVITGTDNNDYLYTGFGADSVQAGLGNDQIFGSAGADTINGGDGHDTLRFEYSNTAVTVNLLLGQGSGGDADGDRYFGIESVYGSQAGDTIIFGTVGSYAAAQGGNDTIIGGASTDVIVGGAGADSMDGGAAMDYVDYRDSPDWVHVDLKQNIVYGGANSHANGDVIVNFECVLGSAHNDTIIGDDNFNVLRGELGNDTITGGKGNDALYGGSTDYNTTIGTDTFVFTALDATANGGLGKDTIWYFGTNGDGSPVANEDILSFTGMFTGSVNASNISQYLQIVNVDADTQTLQIDRDGTGGSTHAWTDLITFKSARDASNTPIALTTAMLDDMYNAGQILIA